MRVEKNHETRNSIETGRITHRLAWGKIKVYAAQWGKAGAYRPCKIDRVSGIRTQRGPQNLPRLLFH